MAEALCLVDSNVLIRWVQPGNIDFPTVTAAIDTLIADGMELCYTSQNLGEFWNVLTRPALRKVVRPVAGRGPSKGKVV